VGTHSIILKVTDALGESATAETTLTIFDNLPPVADAGGPYITGTAEAVTLDGSASFDPNAASGDAVVSYEWDIDDDGVFDDAAGDKPVISEDTVTTLGLGVHSISLRVTDTSGATGTAETTLGIYVNEPVASFTMNPQGEVSAGQPVSLDATGSYQARPDRNIVGYDWDFGDGTTGIGSTVSHTYSQIGQFTVTLTVTDDNVPPKTDVATDIIVVAAGNAPVADAGGPYVIDIGDTLSLDGSGSTDPDIPYGDTIVKYEWDIDGDGVFDTDGIDPIVNLNWEQVDAFLAGLGLYPADPVTGLPKALIALRVTDSTGRSDTDLTTLTIYDNSPAATLTGETRDVRGNILPGVTLTVNGEFAVVSDQQGCYEIVISTAGLYTIVASKDGYRDETVEVNVPDTAQSYSTDFKGDNSLVPDAPNFSFVLACINKWSFPPADGTKLEISKILEVINAWKYPISQ
jgi:PKD repeat protein